VQIFATDVDGDGKTDLGLTGGASWTILPVAFSNGDGTFRVTSPPVADFPARAGEVGAKAASGSQARH
jgi:hypothetical protein